MAGSELTSKDALKQFAADSYTRVRVRVAENRATPIALLVQLALDGEADVRIAVAENPSTPRGLKQFLASDDCADVRYAMAESPHTDLELLKALSRDENPYVAGRAQRTIDLLSTDRAPVLAVSNFRRILFDRSTL
jgi:hypothetical protein